MPTFSTVKTGINCSLAALLAREFVLDLLLLLNDVRICGGAVLNYRCLAANIEDSCAVISICEEGILWDNKSPAPLFSIDLGTRLLLLLSDVSDLEPSSMRPSLAFGSGLFI